MSTYLISTHTLKFDAYFTKIEVRDSTETLVATWLLNQEGYSVDANIAEDCYVLNYAAEFEEPTHKIDVGPGLQFGFDGARMGGIGIVDLRDIGKQDGPANFEIWHELDCCIFRLKKVDGPFGLQLHAANVGCITYEPA